MYENNLIGSIHAHHFKILLKVHVLVGVLVFPCLVFSASSPLVFCCRSVLWSVAGDVIHLWLIVQLAQLYRPVLDFVRLPNGRISGFWVSGCSSYFLVD